MFAAVLDELRERDRRDTERAVAPLRVADDAWVLDTTELDAEAAFAAALRRAQAVFARRAATGPAGRDRNP
jgi:cytidylate kinase